MEIWICKYCLKELVFKNKHTKTGHLAKCKLWAKWKAENLTKDVLENMYSKEHMSLPEITEHFKLESVTTIWKQLKAFGVSMRSISVSKKETRCEARRAKTCLENSGYTHNFDRNAPSRLAWQARILNDEGITNVFQRESVKDKSKTTFLEKYGVENAAELPRNGRSIYSKPHRLIVEALQRAGVIVQVELKLAVEKSYFAYDVVIIGTKKLIEVNGDYWHANPVMYKPDDRVQFGKTTFKFAKDIWKHDEIKIAHAKSLGYEVLTVWESDTKSNLIETIEKVLLYVNDKNQVN